MSRWRVFLFYLALAALHTWPLASNPAHLSLNHNADAQQTEWTLAWIARTLPTDPARLFDGNIFAPEPNTLAYSDPMILPAIVGAPIWWSGGSPVLVYNVVLLVGLTLTGWSGWILANRWTQSPSAALVAGALMAFNPHQLTRLPHVVAAYAWTLPLSVYLADRLTDDPNDRRAAAGLALVVTATAATSMYSLVFVGMLVGLSIGCAAISRRWKSCLVLSGAAGAGVLLALPVLWPYVQFASSGVSRPLESVAQFSATLAGYLATPARMHAWWSAAFYTKDVSVFFLGFAAIALAAVGLCTARHASASARRRIGLLVAMIAVGVVLSLGPATAVYRWAYEWFFPLRGLRAAARFGYLYVMGMAVLAACGVAWLQGRVTAVSARRALPFLALVLVTAETLAAPIATAPFTRVPAIYDQVRSAPDPVLLAELPFFPPEGIHQNGEYVLNATAHWRPLMNGTSGFTPMSYRERAPLLWYFPDTRAFDAIDRFGVTHVMVHLERFAPHEVLAIEETMRQQSLLKLIATDSQGHRLYRVVRPGTAPPGGQRP